MNYTALLLLAEETAKVKPLGWVLIIGFVVIFVLCLLKDSNANKKFNKMISEKYPIKEAFGAMYVTEKGDLLMALGSGTLMGFKRWDLNEIGEVQIDGRGHLSICDTNGNVMKGEYLTPSKKPVKEYAYASFPFGGQAKSYKEFISKHAPQLDAPQK